MGKKSLMKKGVACLLSAAMVLTSTGVVPGTAKTASAAVDVPTPVLSLDFDSGTTSSNTYTEGGIAYTLTDSTITTDPDGTDKVYYNGNSGSSTGFLQSGKVFADKSFSDGISVHMKVRPNTQASDWNFLFGLGYNNDGWQVVDGTIGFIAREWTTAHYTMYVPAGNWQPGHALGVGATQPENPYDYFMQAANCNKWYDVVYVYGTDGKFSIYIDGVLTVQYTAAAGYNQVFNAIGGNSNAIFSLGGNVFTGTSGDATDQKRCDAYYDDVQLYNKTLTQEQVYYLATGVSPTTANKDALNAAITGAEKVRTELYTAASVTAFTEKLNAAKQVKNDISADQSAVDAAVSALNTAKDALALKSVDLTTDLVLDSDMTSSTSVVEKAKKKITAGGHTITALGNSTIEDGYIQASKTGDFGQAGVSIGESVFKDMTASEGLTLNIKWNLAATPVEWQDIFCIANEADQQICRTTFGLWTGAGENNAPIAPTGLLKNGTAWNSFTGFATSGAEMKNFTYTVNSDALRMYINGVLVLERTGGYDIADVLAKAKKIYIGKGYYANDGDMQGQLHGLQIYSRALNAAEVDKLAADGAGTKFEVSSSTVLVEKGATQTVEVKDTVKPADTVIKNAVSGDTGIATVEVRNGKAVITGVAAGSTTVTVDSSYGQSVLCEVTVFTELVAVTSVALNKQTASMEEEDTLTLVATVLPEDATEKGVTWQSDDPSVATVDATGKVTAVGIGTATITATSKENAEKTASCTVIVTEKSGDQGGGTVTDESQLGTYRSDLAYKRVGVHDPSIVQDPATKRYYIFGSHCAWAWSDDLENWTAFKNNITEDVGDTPGTAKTIFADEIAWCKKANPNYDVKGNLWAPDVIWNDTMQKWCMYMTVNGPDWNSTISLLTADRLDGNWTYVGPVIQSGMSKGYGATFDYQRVTGGTDMSRYTGSVSGGGNPTIEAHAIDACVLYDDDGDLWMSYGSWSGGISMIKLDKTTGLRDYSTTYANTNNAAGADGLITDPYTGYKIAGGTAVSGEGSYIKKIGDYYYLFLSYGGFAPTEGYNMRVFRAGDIKGPYKDLADKDARRVINSSAGNVTGSVGMRLMSYYKWSFADYGYTAQGHNSATVDENGKAYVIYHNKYNDGTAAHEVRVHQLLTNEDGWILAAPFEYAGETVETAGYSQKAFTGDYGIMFQKQNVDHANLKCTAEQKIKLEAGTETATGYTGNITGDYTGTWESKTGSPYVTLTIGGTAYKGVFCEGTIDETDVKTMTFTAVGSNQECLWGYRAKDPTVAIRMTMDKVIRFPNEVATDISLPALGVGGSTITWKSNSVAINDDGTVPHLFDEDSKVSMTATITNNGYVYSKVYEFTVVGNTRLSSDSDVELKTFYTDTELDMSSLRQGSCPKFDNPFYYTHEDISGGVAISFDVTRTALSDRLSNIVSFNNKLGKLFFTGGSYLGYNDFNDHFMDANLNAGYVAGTDYLLDNTKVNIKIEILSNGFNVYQNGTKVYSALEVKLGNVPGGFSNNNPENTMLSWLKTAPELNFGSGNFWPDLIFKGKISNVVCTYRQPELDVNGGTSSSLSGLYTQDYENVRDISTEWTSPDGQGYLSLGSGDAGHGKYMLFDLSNSGSNSRGAYSWFGDDIPWPGNYTDYILEYDMSLKAGDNQESQVALATGNFAYSSNNINWGMDSGYVFKMTSTNSETWTINGGSTVTIPRSTWVHFTLTGTKDSAAAHLKITNGDATLFDDDITAPDTGAVKGIYVLAGRYNATYKVDNIVVKEPGVNYVDRTAYDNILARAEQYVAVQEQNAIYSAESFQALKDAIAAAKSTVTNTATQEVVNAQADALKAAIAGLERLSFTVTVGAAENGTVTGLAADGKYFSGDSMSLTAVPDSGYAFGGWKIGADVVSENTTYSAMVTENITITPVFKKGETESPSPSPSVSPSASPSASPTPGTTASPSVSPTPGGSGSNGGSSNWPAASASPSVSPVPSASASPSASATPEASPKPGTSSEPGVTSAPSISPSPSASAKPQVTPAPTSGTVKKDKVYSSGGNKYKVTSATAKKKTVTLKAVKGNKSLKSLTVGATVKIKNQTFKVTGIEKKAFVNCKKLKKVVIGKNVTFVGAQAFANCKNLESVVIKSKVLKKIGKNAFKGINKKAVIKVPNGKLKSYQKLLDKKVQPSTVKIKKA